ncbi:tRNA methyltransferase 2, putative [Bodo saltans]|uniref:tRNA (guanine(37)-N1)-methyltransferase n=1 Tax=Bodo saltans TaxID=75058 RepID=A0A0S4IN72_BODSA|nr:tRNA methyltransferase 2, putative [Bodo saltans]|eukprot:CUE79897.1 tRNA methyltransferase 2, putative [Bodo saltans]
MEYRDAVKEDIQVCSLVVQPREKQPRKDFRNAPKHYCHRGVRNVVDNAERSGKCILLDPTIASPTCSSVKDLPDSVKAALIGLDVSQCAVVSNYTIHLTYENFTMPELLKKVLPQGLVALSGFEQVGHIAHVNLHSGHLPFKHIIGQVVLDTNRTVLTVVNKIDSISSVFREFKMEVIAGVDKLDAVVKQNGFVFHVPYDKVYWNSRLGEEHHRLVSMMAPGDELFDVMAGIGPFAVPAAAAGVKVFANDLNPASVAALNQNATANGVKLTSFNMDGREFIDNVLRTQHLEVSTLPSNRRHISMNLPALAVAFLDSFTRPSWRSGRVIDRHPVVHCYTFSADEDVKKDAVRQVEAVLGVSLDGFLEHVQDVRDVAPTKQMVCVSFRLPDAITEATVKAPVKRQREV